MSYLSYSKNFQGMGDLFLRDPARYLPFVQLLDNVMSTSSELTQTQKEMIALYSSQLNGCNYCVDSHSCVLSKLETDENLISSIANNSTEFLDDKLREVFVFSKKLTVEPENIVQTDINNVTNSGWSDQTVEDIVCIVSTFAFLNRLADGFGLEGSNEHFQQVGSMVAQQGYKPLVSMVQNAVSNS